MVKIIVTYINYLVIWVSMNRNVSNSNLYKTVSIVIPVFNEKETILEILDKIESASVLGLKKEIIIVDDFSTDGTRDILSQLKHKYKIIYHKKNGGKGRALRTGFHFCTGDIVIIQDADMEYDPKDYPKLVKPILERRTKVVYGSRFRSSSGHLKDSVFGYYLHLLGNYGLTMLTNILFFTWITDMETCYKVFDRRILKKVKLRAMRFDFEPEFTAKISKKGYKIFEVPINYYSRGFDEGKKITWRDGVKAAYYLFKYRFRN